MRIPVLLLTAFLFSVTFASAFAAPMIILDKSTYTYGDTIRVSGTVQFEEGMFLVIQLRSSSDMLDIAQMIPSPNGSFSATFEAEGPKWQQSGTYSVRASYSGDTVEKTFEFVKPHETVQQNVGSQSGQTPGQTQAGQPQPSQTPSHEPPRPKITVRGFPDATLSPQQYYNRYNDDQAFREWFDGTFSGYSIQEIVGYKPTYVKDFPDENLSPQHYIERYTNDIDFKEWFDDVFPERSIYDVVGVSEDIKLLVPSWVKQYALWWSSGQIDDSQFAARITDLIRQNIITIEGEIVIAGGENRTIPHWFKNNAKWYSDGHITEDDFLFGIQYLIEQEIIII
jgi:hypothetical protein